MRKKCTTAANTVLKGAHNIIQHIEHGDVKESSPQEISTKGTIGAASQTQEVISPFCEKTPHSAGCEDPWKPSKKYWVHTDIFMFQCVKHQIAHLRSMH